MARKVKAAVMLGPGRIETQEFPYPKIEEGAMLMKMEMSGICGTDKHAYEGKLILYAGTEAETSIKYPFIPGHENVGVVAEISKTACKKLEWSGQELKEGDRVTMCCDLVCGNCWYCRNIHGYPWCKEVKTYGLSFLSIEPPSPGKGKGLFRAFRAPHALKDDIRANPFGEIKNPGLDIHLRRV